MTDLKELIERVEALTGPIDAVAAGGIANSFSRWTPDDPEWRLFVTALGGALEAVGAALALTERMLPGWWCASYPKSAEVHHPTRRVYDAAATGNTRALAILSALLRALQEQEK